MVYQYLLDGPIIIKYIVHIDEILDYMLDLFIIEMLLNIFYYEFSYHSEELGYLLYF